MGVIGIIDKVTVAEGTSGEWSVETFFVDQKGAQLHNMRCIINRQYSREIRVGTYTKLKCNGHIVMTDTPAEMGDHSFFAYEVTGRVLVNGLGLGMIANAIAKKEEVIEILVIEKSEDVIKLVADSVHEKVKIIHADAFLFNPRKEGILKAGEKFDYVWNDIWNNICGDHWEDMKKLHRRYGKWAKNQDSWCREETRRAAR